jgi:hypothetical protein
LPENNSDSDVIAENVQDTDTTSVKKELWISHFEIREEIDKTSFVTIRHSYIFLTYKITEYNSLYSLNI